MLRNWTFGRKVGIGFAASALALIIIAVIAYRSAAELVASEGWVAHTHQVRRQVAELMAQLVDAETGQRGYVITGKDEFLMPYNAALGEIEKTFLDIRQLTADNPRQGRRLDELRPLIDSQLAIMKRQIDDRRKSSSDASAAAIAIGEGKQTLDKIRALVKDMDDDESGLLEVRRQDAELSSQTTKRVVSWGSTIAVLAVGLIGWLIVRSLSQQVGSAVQHVQSSSTELQAAANQQATGAREQSTAMTEIATTINELLATSRQIADSAKRVSQIAGQTASAALAGEATVVRSGDAADTVRKQVDLIVGHMLELGKKSQQIGVVLDIVAELAEQTNILAINATIEAAGAGESGRRFGVVADEIRKLADRVSSSTKEIRGMIEDVRGAVNTTVMVTESGSKAVDAGNALVLEVAASFRQIASLVGTTTDAAREIELSTKQQATAVEQVNIAITGAASATRETATSASQTLQTASQLTELSGRLLAIVQRKAS